MRILELIREQQTIGTIGSSTTPTPIQSTTQTPGTDPASQAQQKPDPHSQQLNSLLKQNQINVNAPDDFLKAFSAIQQKQTLTPDQEKVLGDYAKATITKPGLPTQVAGLMKSIMNNKPATSPAKPMGQAPGAVPPAGV